ncbi:MAG: tail fiber domain-containing protein, partial [Acidobacteria bacterium]|nr:tail fiber domain-containing protein [Acidobacteriota bacterium]
ANSNGALYGSATNHNVEFRSNNITRMEISTTGIVKILERLEVGQPGSITNDVVVNGEIVGFFAPGGEASLCAQPSSNRINKIALCGSSIRFKSHVRGFTPGLDLLSRLRPVSFRWKSSGNEDVGLVAEEVELVEPLLVTRNERGEAEGVKYDRIGVVLLNAVREQQAQIAEQRRQIDLLLRQNSALGSRIRGQATRLVALERAASKTARRRRSLSRR